MPADGLSGTIGLVTSSLDADYTRRLIAGATEVLSANGLSTLCFSPGDAHRTEYEIPLEFVELVNAPKQNGSSEPSAGEPMRYGTEWFVQRIGDLPAVCVGSGIAGIASFWIQNGAGIRLLMKHLTEVCGRRRIAFVRGRERNLEAKSRFLAWEDFCIERSLPHGDDLVELGDFTLPSGEAAALKILEKCSGELPDAFVASNDRMALGVLRALRTKGLRVPIDVSVVGFDDLEAASADPPLTTIRQPIFEMGHRAAEVLIAKLKNESVAEKHMVTPELIVRASCQPNQSKLPINQSDPWSGSSAFLESAPSELLLQLLREPLPSGSVQDPVTSELQSGMRRVGATKQDPVAGVRSMRLSAVENLEQALSRIDTLQGVQDVLRSYMRFLGLESLTAALVSNRTNIQNQVRLVVDCRLADIAPVGKLGSVSGATQIFAAHGQRTRGQLSVAEPLYREGEYCGFLLVSGTLLDNPLLHKLGAVLARVTSRIAA